MNGGYSDFVALKIEKINVLNYFHENKHDQCYCNAFEIDIITVSRTHRSYFNMKKEKSVSAF